MNCKQAGTLIDKFLDKRLSCGEQVEYNNHLDSCEKCRNLMLERKELYYYINIQSGDIPVSSLKTNEIMSSIVNINQNLNFKEAELHALSSMFFRRLGFSMVLAAILMISSFFLPAGRLNIFDTSVYAQTNKHIEKQHVIYDMFASFDNRIKTIINSIDLSFNLKK